MVKFAIAFLLSIATCGVAHADMSPAEFFARDKARNWTGSLGSGSYGAMPTSIPKAGTRAAFIPRGREHVARIVVAHAQKRLGSRWAADALAIAKIENNFRCATPGPRVRSHGGDRAQGPMQVMPRSARALGLDPARLSECEYGVMAGIAHMERCIASGVQTSQQMKACHVAGWAGWRKQLARRAEAYKQSYIRQGMRYRVQLAALAL